MSVIPEPWEDTEQLVHLRRPSTEPRPGAGALCAADHRHGVFTTYCPDYVTCERCLRLRFPDRYLAEHGIQPQEAV